MAQGRLDDTGVGQRFAATIIETCTRLLQRGNDLAICWVASYRASKAGLSVMQNVAVVEAMYAKGCYVNSA